MGNSGRTLALKGAAVVAAALALGGCAATGSSTSSVDVSGSTLAIYVSKPSNPSGYVANTDVIDAEEMAFHQESSEVKDYKLKLDPIQLLKVSNNARAAIINQTSIAYLGELTPGDSELTAGITNAVDLLQVSPTDNALELGASTPAVPGAPQNFFESWSTYKRTFARVAPTSAQEAAFLVKTMLSLGKDKLYIDNDGTDYGKAMAEALKEIAGHAGLTLVSSESDANAIFYGSRSPQRAAGFFNNAVGQAPSATLFGPSALDANSFVSSLSSSVKSLYISVPGFATDKLTAAGKTFTSDFEKTYHHQPVPQAIFGYAAMSAVLAVIKRAGVAADDRETVVKDFLKYKTTTSVLGSYSINSDGNTSLDAFVLEQLSGGHLTPVTAPLHS